MIRPFCGINVTSEEEYKKIVKKECGSWCFVWL